MINSALREQLSTVLGIPEPVVEVMTESSANIVAVNGPSVLSDNVEKVILQFSFKHDFLVPSWVWRAKDETLEEREMRKSLPMSVPGVQFIPNTKNTSGAGLREKLLAEGFTLVDGFFKERLGSNASRESDRYHAVRFTFYRMVLGVTDTYREILDREVGPSLDDILERSVWRVRAYNNPLVQKGEVVGEKRMASINLDFPEPANRETFRVLTVEDHELILR